MTYVLPVHNWGEHCNPILHDRGRVLVVPWQFVSHSILDFAFHMYHVELTTCFHAQGSQHEKQCPKKVVSNPRAKPLTRHTFWVPLESAKYNLERCWALRNTGSQPAYLWFSVHKVSFLQPVLTFLSPAAWGRWSMWCTSRAVLLGQVVTLSVNVTSDPGWATH